MPPPFVTRVRVKNYRSIAGCDVSLGPVTFLVGANGSGKSNFLDGLRLIADALTTSLDHALRDRGGIADVRRRSSGHPTHFGIRVDFTMPDGASGFYAFEVSAKPRGTYAVKHEECAVGGRRYAVSEGVLETAPADVSPPASADRLYLVNAAGLPVFRPVYDLLTRMGFYNVAPQRIRELQSPDQGDVLKREGENLASVLTQLELPEASPIKDRIREYLAVVVPGVEDFYPRRVGHMETVEFRQRVEASSEPWRFSAMNMSDGTLRALAILVALFYRGRGVEIPLIGIEEPETALHPAAAGALRDCILEASRHVQIIITSHSADLLDDDSVTDDMLRAVESIGNRTTIGRIDEASRSALRDRLFTAGELLRSSQLQPDPTAAARSEQLDLFADEP